MQVDNGTMALIIATISSAGFAINIALPGICASAYGIVTGRSQAEVLLNRRTFGFRFIEKFYSAKWVTLFIVISAFFLISDVMDIIWAFTGWPNLCFTICITVIALILTLIAWISVIASSNLITTGEVNQMFSGLVPEPPQGTSPDPATNNKPPKKKQGRKGD